MNQCRIFLVRHGLSTHNRDGITSGYSDPELTEEGIAQARRTGEALAHITFDEVYSSDLRRAVDTAAIISGRPVHKSHQRVGLRERSFGSLDGKPNVHLQALRNDPKVLALSHEELWAHKLADDIESDQELALRFEQALREIAGAHLGKTILIAAHGGTLRTLLTHLGYAKPGELGYGSIDNAAYVELLYDGTTFTLGEMSGVHKTAL